MPVNWLKLIAFAFGAGTAALTGTLVTALNGSVFPQTFEFPLLITIYTMVILGGAGSQAGVVIGAIGISVLLELLREPGDSRFLFYAIVLAGLIGALRFSRRLAFVLAGTVVFGVASCTSSPGDRRRAGPRAWRAAAAGSATGRPTGSSSRAISPAG